MRNILLRLISLFTIFNLLFYSVYPSVTVLAQDEYYFGEDEGGDDDESSGDEGTSDESSPDDQGGGGDESNDIGGDWDAYSEDTPEALNQDPEFPQESFDFAQDQQPSVSTQGGPFKAPGLSYILPPEQEPPASLDLQTEQQQQVAYYDDLLSSEEQNQLVSQAREEYQKQVSQDPVVDQGSQDSAVSAYGEATDTAASGSDQEVSEGRSEADADAQGITNALVATLERGQQVPDDWWQDYGRKLGDLSDGVVDTITSQVREAQERGEQKKAEEAIEEAERRAEQDEKEYTEGLAQWKNASLEEKLQKTREALGLPDYITNDRLIDYLNQQGEFGPRVAILDGQLQLLENYLNPDRSDRLTQAYVTDYTGLPPDALEKGIITEDMLRSALNNTHLKNTKTLGFSKESLGDKGYNFMQKAIENSYKDAVANLENMGSKEPLQTVNDYLNRVKEIEKEIYIVSRTGTIMDKYDIERLAPIFVPELAVPKPSPLSPEHEQSVINYWLEQGVSQEKIDGVISDIEELLTTQNNNLGKTPLGEKVRLATYGYDDRQNWPEKDQRLAKLVDVINYNWQDYQTRSSIKLKDEKALILNTILKQEKDQQLLEPLLNETQDILKNYKEQLSASGSDPSTLSHLDKVVDQGSYHISDLGSFYIPYDNNILISSNSSLSTVIHESIHRASFRGNSDHPSQLINIVGDDAGKVWEGITEWITLDATSRLGKNEDPVYKPQVNMVSNFIFDMQSKRGLSYNEAKNIILEAGLAGHYDKLINNLGEERFKQMVTVTPKGDSLIDDDRMQIISPYDLAKARGDATEEIKSQNQNTNPQSSKFNKSRPNALINDVYAQEQQIKGNESELFELLVRKNLVKNTLEERGRVDEDYFETLFLTDIFGDHIQQKPNGLDVVTGRSGTAGGEIESGKYIINSVALADYDIKVPAFVELKAGTTIVPIGIREGSGKVEKTAGIRNVGSPRFAGEAGGPFDVYAQAESFDGEPSRTTQDPELPKVKVAAFYDENGNGNWDGREKALPWAGIQVSLTKINQEKTVSMLPGWNLITLTALPTQPLTASSLLGQIAKQGGYATTVSKLEAGSWKSYVIRGDNSFSGEDFAIEPGKAYFVKNLKRALLAFEGQEFATPVEVNLNDGWNAVGFPKTAGQYSVSTLIDELNIQDAGADAAARWESGLWDSFVKKGESYGENFAVEPNRGYIVRLKKGVELTP